MWGLCLSVGVGGGAIISGYIIEGMNMSCATLRQSLIAGASIDLGWNWTYGICAILYGVFILVLLVRSWV